jgi:hypothetical protein
MFLDRYIQQRLPMSINTQFGFKRINTMKKIWIADWLTIYIFVAVLTLQRYLSSRTLNCDTLSKNERSIWIKVYKISPRYSSK